MVAVGGAAIDRTPTALKDWAIRNFGTNDKLVLQLGIVAVLAVLAVVLGLVAVRHRRVGSAGVLLFGVIGALAATTRPESTGIADAAPSVIGALVGAWLLYALSGRARSTAAEEPPRAAPNPDGTGAGSSRSRRPPPPSPPAPGCWPGRRAARRT